MSRLLAPDHTRTPAVPELFRAAVRDNGVSRYGWLVAPPDGAAVPAENPP